MDEVKDAALLFLTIEQWKTWIFIVVITSAITETAKRVFFINMAKIKKKRYLYGTAFCVGVLTAASGYAMVGVKLTPDYYWAMFGVTAGPAANFAHYLSLGFIAKWAPELANSLKGKR